MKNPIDTIQKSIQQNAIYLKNTNQRHFYM